MATGEDERGKAVGMKEMDSALQKLLPKISSVEDRIRLIMLFIVSQNGAGAAACVCSCSLHAVLSRFAPRSPPRDYRPASGMLLPYLPSLRVQASSRPIGEPLSTPPSWKMMRYARPPPDRTTGRRPK